MGVELLLQLFVEDYMVPHDEGVLLFVENGLLALLPRYAVVEVEARFSTLQ